MANVGLRSIVNSTQNPIELQKEEIVKNSNANPMDELEKSREVI